MATMSDRDWRAYADQLIARHAVRPPPPPQQAMPQQQQQQPQPQQVQQQQQQKANPAASNALLMQLLDKRHPVGDPKRDKLQALIAAQQGGQDISAMVQEMIGLKGDAPAASSATALPGRPAPGAPATYKMLEALAQEHANALNVVSGRCALALDEAKAVRAELTELKEFTVQLMVRLDESTKIQRDLMDLLTAPTRGQIAITEEPQTTPSTSSTLEENAA